MLKVKPETEEALQAGRLRHLVFFDFMFFPTRVHDGEGAIEWEGQEWEGVGHRLMPREGQPPWSMTYFSPQKSNTGHLFASLPLDKMVSGVVTKGLYRGRPMTMLLCSLDEGGEIIERFGILPYSIVECAIKGQRATFKALDQRLASAQELDAIHEDDVEAIRSRFKWALADTTASSALGWAMNAFAAVTGNVVGILLDAILVALPGRRRALVQRWRVRKRVYWFTTQPEIPRLFRRKRGYRVRADTLEEAKDVLIREVVAKVWLARISHQGG